jgi:hypothetical protein
MFECGNQVAVSIGLQIAPVADDFSDPKSVNMSVVYVKLCFTYDCDVDCTPCTAKMSIN